MRREPRVLTRRALTRKASIAAAVALLAIAAALLQLTRGADGITVTHATLGSTPVTVFRPQSATAAPVVVIAHGFAGSQQLMQPFALTLAHAGYVAVTFDFLGHGRNPEPMRGDITEGTRITDALLTELGTVSDFARGLTQTDGRLAVLGHSMASDIVVKYAVAHPEVTATVAVSVFSKAATATLPKNLLVIVGALEPSMLRDEGLRIVGLAANGDAVPGRSYGEPGNGTARRMIEARGVEHIGVLYSRDSLTGTLTWLNDAFDRTQTGAIDARGKWLALLFAGILLLAWPLSQLLPTVGAVAPAMDLRWRDLLLAAAAPMVLTPLMLWKMPTDFLPILLGDYLTLHFVLYGALTAAALVWICGWRSVSAQLRLAIGTWRALAVAALAVTAFNIVAFGWPIDRWLFSFWPIAPRWPVIAVIACGTIPYFIADEALNSTANRSGGYALTKFCFLISLAFAIVLNPPKLFFLAIIVPAVLLLFMMFGIISRLSLRATGHPLPGALGNALLFAWAIGVTFPMVTR